MNTLKLLTQVLPIFTLINVYPIFAQSNESSQTHVSNEGGYESDRGDRNPAYVGEITVSENVLHDGTSLENPPPEETTQLSGYENIDSFIDAGLIY
jgi:hypothetical protein